MKHLYVTSSGSCNHLGHLDIHRNAIQLGGGGVQGQGKGQRLMTTFGWQHARVESTKSNPPRH